MRAHITNMSKIVRYVNETSEDKSSSLLKDAKVVPWEKLCIDLIGPYKKEVHYIQMCYHD
jgi:hypothetical protein